MRIPSIILLSSVALSLLVRAEDMSAGTTISTNVADLGSVAADVKAAAPAPAPAKLDDQAPNVDAKVSAAPESADVTIKPQEEGDKKTVEEDKEKVYPVGKGIVYTKTSFFIDHKDKKDKDNKDQENENQTQDGEQQVEGQDPDSKKKEGRQTIGDAMTFVGNLLGIDLDLGIGIGIGGGKDKGRDKGRNKGKTPPGVRDWTLSWEELVLYGDDGYEKRPVPEGCPKLEFENQMIWDQQGNRGGEFTNDSAPKARRDLKTDGADDKKETVEIVKGSTPSSEATTEETKVVPESGDDKTVNKAPTEEDTKPSEGGDKGTTPTDIKEDDKKDTKKVKPDGIQICLLGPCDNDDDDRDKDGDDERPRHHRIYHKQKRFLKQYRGRALRIDSVTKCPLPGTA